MSLFGKHMHVSQYRGFLVSYLNREYVDMIVWAPYEYIVVRIIVVSCLYREYLMICDVVWQPMNLPF